MYIWGEWSIFHGGCSSFILPFRTKVWNSLIVYFFFLPFDYLGDLLGMILAGTDFVALTVAFLGALACGRTCFLGFFLVTCGSFFCMFWDVAFIASICLQHFDAAWALCKTPKPLCQADGYVLHSGSYTLCCKVHKPRYLLLVYDVA